MKSEVPGERLGRPRLGDLRLGAAQAAARDAVRRSNRDTGHNHSDRCSLWVVLRRNVRKRPMRQRVTEFNQMRQKAGLTIPQAAERLGYAERTVYRWDRGDSPVRKVVLDNLRHIAFGGALKKRESGFRFVDLFAGIGGLRKGFESIGGSCVYTSEWNKYSQLTYRANFPTDDHDIAGDITKIEAPDIPQHEVLLAGFPCQPFSIAGVSKKNALGRPHGFRCDAQGTLFFDVARIIEHHQPKAFLLENVKNLVSHDRGNTFRVIHQTLTQELGYHVVAKVIDGRCFVPQHRERIYIVGFRDENAFSFDGIALPDAAKGPRLETILHREDGTEPTDEFTSPYLDPETRKVRSKYTLSAHLWRYLKSYAEKHQAKGNGFGFGIVGPEDVSRTLSARYYKDGSEILVRQRGKPPRRLTPRECARLMGFDDRENRLRIPVSDTQAYKQFGNSVVVPVVKAVAEQMKPWITGEAAEDLFCAARKRSGVG
jgi:DNA (cytosine-5)-methyltransferase 1